MVTKTIVASVAGERESQFPISYFTTIINRKRKTEEETSQKKIVFIGEDGLSGGKGLSWWRENKAVYTTESVAYERQEQ